MTESEKAGSSMTFDITQRLDRVLWRAVFQFVGGSSYLSVAGTRQEFRTLYREEYDEPTTSAEEFVHTVAGAELFLREAGEDAEFYIEKENLWFSDSFKFTPLRFIQYTAALNGRLEVLQWSVAQGFPLDDTMTCMCAAYGGNLSLLQWLRANGSLWDEATCLSAAKMGHLTVLQWARTNGCPWSLGTCTYAAMNGHLNVLQWARANGCPWDGGMCLEAAANGHLPVLQWAHTNGCPWDERTCYEAAKHGHLAVLQWARANGCPWDEETCYGAAKNGRLSVLQWAYANGCPMHYDDTLRLAEISGHVDVAEWTRENVHEHTNALRYSEIAGDAFEVEEIFYD